VVQRPRALHQNKHIAEAEVSIYRHTNRHACRKL
jgi:hypothetical protein